MIVGAGPAGVAAAIQLTRSGRGPLLLEADRVGGLIRNAHWVENFPGLPNGCTGPDLAGLLEDHLKAVGAVWTRERVLQTCRKDSLYRVRTKRREVFSRALILASGTLPKRADLPGETALLGTRVFYEVKDIPFGMKARSVLVLGSGDAALDYALGLAGRGKKVRILFRSRALKALPLLCQRAENHPRITLLPNAQPLSVAAQENQIALCVLCNGKEMRIASDILLIALGREPCLEVLTPAQRAKSTLHSIEQPRLPGLYLAGDVRGGDFRQAGIAAGEGLKAAMLAERYLKERKR